MTNPITTGDTVTVLQGCEALSIRKGSRLTIGEVTKLGPDYGHSVKVVLVSRDGSRRALYARHINRLGDSELNLNNGDPTKKVRIAKTLP